MKWVGDSHVDEPRREPDLTEPIMRRLGFERIEGREARRLRRMRWTGRVMVLASIVGVIGFGVYIHSLSSRARKPMKNSIPEALDDTFAQSANMGETIREIASFLSHPDAAPMATEEAAGVKPRSNTDEQQSRVPFSDLE